MTRKVEEIKEHRAVEDYEQNEDYHRFYVRPSGNCSVINDITEHRISNFSIDEERMLIIARIKK